MTQKLRQCVIRGNNVSIELYEVDELGRVLGEIVTVEATVSADLRSAIDAQIALAKTAQDQTIAAAKAARAINPTAEVSLVADLRVR